jgi:hypothetical protein
LTRELTETELETLAGALGTKPSPQAIEDVLWAVNMLPQCMIVR